MTRRRWRTFFVGKGVAGPDKQVVLQSVGSDGRLGAVRRRP